jgi:hypothetical protein
MLSEERNARPARKLIGRIESVRPPSRPNTRRERLHSVLSWLGPEQPAEAVLDFAGSAETYVRLRRRRLA